MAQSFDGLVVKDQSGFYWVEVADGTVYRCELRGRLKEAAKASSIVTIGDRVTFVVRTETGIDEPTGVIEKVAERKNTLSRAVRTKGKQGAGQAEREQVFIANADQALFVFAATQPTPNFRLLDRLLVAGEQSEIERLVIIVNKTDLEDPSAIDAQFAPYAGMGYEILYTSALQDVGIEELQEMLKDRLSIFTGPSGVGKTSLLNCLQPGLARQVKSVSQQTSEGMHTTRDSALIKLGNGGYIADTPGIRSMAVWDVEPDELDGYFLDIAKHVENCRFRDCTHTDEPGCAVKAAVKAGNIHQTRYDNFLHLRDDLIETFIVYER